MNHSDDKLKDLEGFTMTNDPSSDISLDDLNVSIGSGDRVKNQDAHISKNEDRSETLLDSIQFLHDLLMGFQIKLKEYEAISEYMPSESIEVIKPQKWKSLSESDVKIQLPTLKNCFANTFTDINNKMRNMDMAVVRLRNENEKLIDKIKIEKLNKKKNRNESEERPYKTVTNSYSPKAKDDMIEELKSDKEGLEKKIKKLDTKISELKKEISDLKSETADWESKYENCNKENKKLVKQIKNLKEERETTHTEELNDLLKQMKIMFNNIKETELEIKEQKKSLSESTFKENDSKIDRLIELVSKNEQESKLDCLIEIISKKEPREIEIMERIQKEIKLTREEIKKEISQNMNSQIRERENITSKEKETIEKHRDLLRERIEELKKEIEMKDKKISEQETCFKCKETDLMKAIEFVEASKTQAYQYLDNEMEYLICKCHDSYEEHKSSKIMPKVLDIEGQNNRMESYDAKCVSIENDIDQEMENDYQNLTTNELIIIINEKNLLLQQKNEALQTTRNKVKPSMEKNYIFEYEIKEHLQKIKDLETEIIPLRENTKIKNETFEKMTNKIRELMMQKVELEENVTKYHQEIDDLRLEMGTLKEKVDKKERAINNMKEKIKTFTGLENSLDEIEKWKRQFEEANATKLKLEGIINSQKVKNNEIFEECEKYKKDKLRLETELVNMKKLQFRNKTGQL